MVFRRSFRRGSKFGRRRRRFGSRSGTRRAGLGVKKVVRRMIAPIRPSLLHSDVMQLDNRPTNATWFTPEAFLDGSVAGYEMGQSYYRIVNLSAINGQTLVQAEDVSASTGNQRSNVRLKMLRVAMKFFPGLASVGTMTPDTIINKRVRVIIAQWTDNSPLYLAAAPTIDTFLENNGSTPSAANDYIIDAPKQVVARSSWRFMMDKTFRFNNTRGYIIEFKKIFKLHSRYSVATIANTAGGESGSGHGQIYMLVICGSDSDEFTPTTGANFVRFNLSSRTWYTSNL